MNPYPTLCDDFGLAMYLNTRMELPTRRETVLHFFETLQKAFPQTLNEATVMVRTTHADTPAITAALTDLEHRAVASGQFSAPVAIDHNPDGTIALLTIGMQGSGVDAKATTALHTLREQWLLGQKMIVVLDDSHVEAILADISAGGEFGAALAHEDAACGDEFTAKSFHPESFADAVASVADAAAAFLVCHRI